MIPPSQITVSIKPELHQSVFNTSSFKPGSTLSLKVLELCGGRALIDFGSFRATADVKVPVTLGEELLVRVQESGRLLKLSLLSPEPKNISSADSIAPRPEKLPEEKFKRIQSDLKQILNHYLESKTTGKIPKPIFDLVENQAALQKIFDSKKLATLSRVVDVLLTEHTSQQGRAVKQGDSVELFQVFTYALAPEKEKQAAKLKIYYPKKEKAGSKKGFQISLLLAMDRLGDLRTDFYLLEKDLTMTFFVQDQTTRLKIQENSPELRELLNPFFNQVLLRIMVSKTKIKDFGHEDIQTISERRLDIRI